MSDAWYFVDGDEQVGPITHEQLRTFLVSPNGGENVLVWRKGFPDWKAAREVVELAVVFERPPPIPRRVVRTAPVADPLVTNSVHAAPKQESAAKKALGTFASLISALIGYLAFRYYGTTFIWPAALIGGAWFILSRCKVGPVAVPMLALVIGHTGWLVVGHVALMIMGNPIDASVLVDVAVVTTLVVWFLRARSRASVIGVLLYQIIALVSGVLLMGERTIPGASSEVMVLAQATHIVLRFVGIGFCIYAFFKLRKEPSPAELSQVF